MSISQYVIGGSAIAVAVAVGYAKWTSKSAEVATGRADVAIVKAECATQNVEDTTAALNRQINDLTSEVNRQKKIASDRAAAERLAWSRVNKLKAEIANVKSNPPVPDSIELVLDRLRATVDGSGSATGSADENGNGGEAGSSRDKVPAATEATTKTSAGEHAEQ